MKLNNEFIAIEKSMITFNKTQTVKIK